MEANNKSDRKGKPTIPWLNKIGRYLAKGRKADALRFLDKVIEYDDLPLFTNDPAMQEARRVAWLYRIDLLCEWGRLSEALAWTCLECELNPENIPAKALKERLKKILHLSVQRSSFISKKKIQNVDGGRWRGVAGMRDVKAILERDVILPLQEPELYKRYRVDLPNGILFYGPPGCGKTFIARKLAEVLEFTFIEKRPSDLASIYVHGGQQKIGELFEEAKKNAPTLLFLDELDALVPNRGDSFISHHYSAEVNEFLIQLNECWKSKILVIGATNLLQKVDPAVRRPGRMDKKVFIGPPDIEARVELIKLYMDNRPQATIDWLNIAEACDLYTSAELEQIVNDAARYALQERRSISEEDIFNAIKENKRTLTLEKIEEAKSAM